MILEDEKDTILASYFHNIPLYSACIQLIGSTLAGYDLNEDDAWSVDINNLKDIYKKYYDNGHRVKSNGYYKSWKSYWEYFIRIKYQGHY